MSKPRDKIILVDDNLTNLDHGRDILRTFYEVYPAPSAEKMFEILGKIIPSLILLDIAMPDMDGYEAIKIIKSNNRFMDIPVIFLSSMNDEESERRGLDLGAVDYIFKPFSGPLLLKRIENQLLIVHKTKDLLASQAALKDHAENLETKVHEKAIEVFKLQNAVLATVSDLVEFRDKLTGGHISRTRLYLQSLVAEMIKDGVYLDKVLSWDMDFFLPSAQLHDVGKIGITDMILNKPGKLTPEEFEIMKTHVKIGVEAIEKIMSETDENDFLNHALQIAGTHHEKWDGTGYPAGLKGMEIPIEGQLMAIADVYDALISARSYKKAMTHGEACNIIENGAGTHFDPVLVDVFKNIKTEFEMTVQKIGWQFPE